jgi:hypothetical protein
MFKRKLILVWFAIWHSCCTWQIFESNAWKLESSWFWYWIKLIFSLILFIWDVQVKIMTCPVHFVGLQMCLQYCLGCKQLCASHLFIIRDWGTTTEHCKGKKITLVHGKMFGCHSILNTYPQLIQSGVKEK